MQACRELFYGARVSSTPDTLIGKMQERNYVASYRQGTSSVTCVQVCRCLFVGWMTLGNTGFVVTPSRSSAERRRLLWITWQGRTLALSGMFTCRYMHLVLESR